MTNNGQQNCPFGYDLIDGKLVVNPVKAELVKWYYATYQAYSEHPPVELVEATIHRYLADYNEQLTYEEAEKKVAHDAIIDYMASEAKVKWRLFSLTVQEKTPEALLAILGLTLAEAKAQLAKAHEARNSAFEKRHEAIIPSELWEQVQQKLKEKREL